MVSGRTAETLDSTVADLAGPGRAIVADVSDAENVDRLFEEISAEYGRLDLLFNNAGVSAPAVPVDELDPEQWRRVIDVNLTGSFLCARRAFGLMSTQQPSGGRIINNGSVSATTPRPFSAPYTASKHAITGLTKSLSLDGRSRGIAVGQIDIGNAHTEMVDAMAAGILQPTGDVAVEATMDVSHAADAVVHMAGLPLDSNVLFMTVMANAMPFVGRG